MFRVSRYFFFYVVSGKLREGEAFCQKKKKIIKY